MDCGLRFARLRRGHAVLATRTIGTMEVHHFELIMTWILKQGRQDSDAQAVALTLSRGLIDDPDPVDDSDMTNDRPIESLLPRLLADFPEIFWSLIGQAIVSDQTWAWHFEHSTGILVLDR